MRWHRAAAGVAALAVMQVVTAQIPPHEPGAVPPGATPPAARTSSPAPIPMGANTVDVLLRDGTVLAVRAIAGSPAEGFELQLATGPRRVGGTDVLATFGPPASEPSLPAAHLAGGDIVFGEVAGGDATGDHLELQSPVLGRVRLAVDRLAALAAPGVASPLRLRLPDGVGEALFVRAAVGFDTIAGTLHQFGDAGVRFQPDGADAPRWFGRGDFIALRLAEATARRAPESARLLTRAGDRLAVTELRWIGEQLRGVIEGDAAVTLRASDAAALAFRHDVVCLSDLEPAAREESGYDGDVVHPLRLDRNALGGPLVSGGRAYAKGLGVHARSTLRYVVPAGCDRFWTRVGYDDTATGLRLEPRADVRVLVGKQVVFEQKDLGAGQGTRDIGLVPVQPGDTVTLEVDHGRGRDLGDRVNWLSPVFLPAPRRT